MRRVKKINWYVMKPARYENVDESPFMWEIRGALDGSIRDMEMKTGLTESAYYKPFPNKRAAKRYISDAIKRKVDELRDMWED